MSDWAGAVGAVMLLIVGGVVYFLPTINAKSRKHPNRSSIFLLNLFLGWTLIGWVAALVWSATAIAPPEPIRVKSTEVPEPDKYQQLEKLGSLKERGLITDDEYQAEKSRLLSS